MGPARGQGSHQRSSTTALVGKSRAADTKGDEALPEGPGVEPRRIARRVGGRTPGTTAIGKSRKRMAHFREEQRSKKLFRATPGLQSYNDFSWLPIFPPRLGAGGTRKRLNCVTLLPRVGGRLVDSRGEGEFEQPEDLFLGSIEGRGDGQSSATAALRVAIDLGPQHDDMG